jgi:methanol---5-hydroxybenzimidazolylcobamide Co-methyltransferase
MSNGLKIKNLAEFIYGRAPSPVTCGNGVVIGGGEVVPEINFTLPSMNINESTWSQVRREYDDMIDGILKRAVELQVPRLLVEFETLPEMTTNYKWGLEITRLLADKMSEAGEKHSLKSALRLTINDVREFNRPPIMRSGKYWDAMLKFMDNGAEHGADLLAIESTGGKEVCDEALVMADINSVIFALGVLGARDMKFLWKHIVDACRRSGMIASGDSACGFANTAMVLAEQRMIPSVFAAIVRVAAVPRSLVAITQGAKGPTKDCAYEGPFIKAISGVPISMEGRSAACAHLSPVGNVSQAVCDCWSNESVQNIKLLSANAPTVSMEQLAYDCRLMKAARDSSEQDAFKLRDWLSDSDSKLNPQAYVLRPDSVLKLSEKIIATDDPYKQTVIAARETYNLIKEAGEAGELFLNDNDRKWLNILDMQLEMIPDSEEKLIEEMLSRPDMKDKFIPGEYGL